MEDGEYHFDAIHSIAVTEDGLHIVVYVNGANGIWGLRLPTAEIPPLIAKLFATSMEGTKRSGDTTMRSLAIHELRIIDAPKAADRSVLAVTLSPGSPPLAMDLPRDGLIEVARNLLLSIGEIPSEKPSSIQ